jgi:hypothetical protein
VTDDRDDEEELLAWFKIHEVGAPAKRWTLFLYRDFLAFEPRKGRDFEIDREDLPEMVQKLESGLFLKRTLWVKLGSKTVAFQLPPDEFAAVKAWIGPPTEEDLKVALKRRLKWVVPIGILFVLAAAPVADQEWEPVSLTLGLGLITTAWFAKLWPHRNIFLLDSLWFACLAGNSIWLLSQEWGWFRFFMLVVQLLCVKAGWSEYRQFGPEKTPVADEQWQEDDRER